MDKLSDLRNVTDSDCRWLKQELDRMPRTGSLDIGECDLPPGCIPARAALSFGRQASCYSICLDREVSYTGTNRHMRSLSDGVPLLFPTFGDFLTFLWGLPGEAAPTSPNRTAANSGTTGGGYDLSSIVDMQSVTMPTPQHTAPPTRKAIERELKKEIMGQDEAIEAVSHQVALHVQKQNPKRPLSIFMWGEPGTGKTETAKALADVLSRLGPHPYTEVWTDLNTFTEAHSAYRLTGAPPGYTGYDDAPILEASVHHPYTVYIWDETEKAHPAVMKVFQGLLDEGRVAARKELPDHTRHYDFRRSIHIFTSNLNLGDIGKRSWKIGFTAPKGIGEATRDIRLDKGAVDIRYDTSLHDPAADTPDTTRRIYHNTEAARKAFVESGQLKELASRFSCFVEFKPLEDDAKLLILAKQVVDTGLEYDIRLSHISPAIMQALVNAATSGNALTVRSFKSVIEGYLATAFAEAGAKHSGQAVRLEGTLEAPQLKLA